MRGTTNAVNPFLGVIGFFCIIHALWQSCRREKPGRKDRKHNGINKKFMMFKRHILGGKKRG
jgi:hypothetical protein